MHQTTYTLTWIPILLLATCNELLRSLLRQFAGGVHKRKTLNFPWNAKAFFSMNHPQLNELSPHIAHGWGMGDVEASSCGSCARAMAEQYINPVPCRNDAVRLLRMLRSPCGVFFSDAQIDPGLCKYNTWGSKGSLVGCQKWELWKCFVSSNIYSVVETVNDIGLSWVGSGIFNGVHTPFSPKHAW